MESYQQRIAMNELVQLVPGDIDFSILASLFRPTEIAFVLGVIGSVVWPMWFFIKRLGMTTVGSLSYFNALAGSLWILAW